MDRYVGHLPGVRLADGIAEVELARGRLRQVGFDEWRQLDDWFPFRARDYERTAPVFFEISLETSDDDRVKAEAVAAFRNGTDQASAARASIYRSLLLMSGHTIPNPEFSMSYYSWNSGDQFGSWRRVGAANRELIVFASEMEAIAVQQSAASAIDDVQTLMSGAVGPVVAVIQAIVRTARPEFGSLNQVLHLVAGLEQLLVRRGEPLTETFARRFAVLGAVDSVRQWYDDARMAYVIRSDLIHGRPVALADRVQSDEFFEGYFRVLVCHMAIRALHLLDGSRDLDDFHQELDLTFEDPTRLEQLARRWGQE